MLMPGLKPLTNTYSSSGMGTLLRLLKEIFASSVKFASATLPSTPNAQSLMVLTSISPSISGSAETKFLRPTLTLKCTPTKPTPHPKSTSGTMTEALTSLAELSCSECSSMFDQSSIRSMRPRS